MKKFKPGYQYTVTFLPEQELMGHPDFLYPWPGIIVMKLQAIHITHCGETFNLNFNKDGELGIPERFRDPYNESSIRRYALEVLNYVKIHKSRKLTKKELASLPRAV